MPDPRRPLPPWERPAGGAPITGPTRNRWPRAYDGGQPAESAQDRRKSRPDAERSPQGASKSTSFMDNLRQSPVRNGLIGLAVAGAATPLAINRYQQALRTDPSHERIVTQSTTKQQLDDVAVANAWRSMETERSEKVSEREQVIQQSLEEFSEYNLTRELAEDIYDMAQEANVDPQVAFGLVRAESSFKNTSTSYVGAIGLTQLMPATARWLEPGISTDELRNPETNLRIGFGYLRQLIDKYKGDVDLALTAYNRGPGTVDRVLKKGGNPDNGYADFVKTGDVGSHEL